MSRFARLVNAQPEAPKETNPSPQDSLSIQDSPSTQTSPAIKDSLLTPDRLSREHPPPPPQDSLSNTDRPPTSDSPPNLDNPDVLSLIPQVGGHTTLPHAYTDHLCRWLSADEQAVYVQLYRLSWGWGKDTCFISNRRLSERSGVPETSMRRAVRKLIAKRLIEKTNRVFGSNTDQGIEYKVSTLDSLSKQNSASSTDRLSNTAPNKERVFKETDSKGGDASLCPDCMGTGFYYPEGTSKGVKRCEHLKLRKMSK